jgi:hypothetical protein
MNCPHCEQPLISLTIKDLDGNVLLGSKWKCIALGCPRCQKAISAQIDPIAIRSDLLAAIQQQNRR